MDFKTAIQQLTPTMYSDLKRAVALGRWPDGTPLTDQQKQHCMQAVIAYDQLFVAEEERVGFMEPTNQCPTNGNNKEVDKIKVNDLT